MEKKKNIIMIILVIIEIPIIETILFELENMMHFFSISLQKNLRTLKFPLKKIDKMFKSKIRSKYVSSVFV